MNRTSPVHRGVQLRDTESPSLKKKARTLTEQVRAGLAIEGGWQLFENAPDAMVACGPDGRIVNANSQCFALFGYERDELIGATIEELIPSRFRASHQDYREGFSAAPSSRAMRTGRDIVGLKKDGSEIPVEVSLSTLKSNGVKLALASIRDRSERTLSAQQLQEQAEFERIVAGVSATLINLPPERVDAEIRNGLKILTEALEGDRASIGFVDAESGNILVAYNWTRENFMEFPKIILEDTFPWLAQRIKMGETVIGPDDFPLEACAERNHVESTGLKSSLVVPLRAGGKVVGAMSCSCFRERQQWDTAKVSRFQAMADAFANALMRKQADQKLQSAYAEIQRLKEQADRENRYLRQEIKLEHSHKLVVGKSKPMLAVLKKAEQVAGTDSTVLVLGETGTGKELLARTIHELSRRNKRAMIKTNCAALPATLIESELFGREKGAYTGSLAREIGRFELADQSTIFLDEIGELPPETQSKLLRILQEGEFERLGSSRTIKVNVRVIAATSRDLPAMVKEGKFRSDLFYRLNVFPIVVPPLRERTGDIPALVWHILEELGPRMGRKIDSVEAVTMKSLQRCAWPGNVRELRNVIERNLILSTGTVFRAEIPELEDAVNSTVRSLEEVESEYLRGILQSKGWRIRGKGGAAEVIGLKATTIEARMKKLGILRPA
jgi:formate hydrogenlyase transcriptional activator